LKRHTTAFVESSDQTACIHDKPVFQCAGCLQAIEAMEVSGLEAAHSSAAAASGGAAAAAEAKEEVPSDLLCPITYQLLEDPVILVDSHQTYGEDMIRIFGLGYVDGPAVRLFVAQPVCRPLKGCLVVHEQCRLICCALSLTSWGTYGNFSSTTAYITAICVAFM
jgi:hypothetical protein